MLLAIGTILTAVFLLFAKTKRPRGIRLLLFGIVLGALTIQGMGLANKAENEAFERFAAETEPLIVAIKAYERQHGVPPERLEQLVPAFLPAIPDAGLSAAPRWRYSQNRQADGSTEWRLAVVVAMLGEIIYVPDPGCGSRGAKVTGGHGVTGRGSGTAWTAGSARQRSLPALALYWPAHWGSAASPLRLV